MFLDTLTQRLNQSIHRYPEVLSYLNSRSVTDDDIRDYGIGYSKLISVPKEVNTDYKRFMDECWRGRKLENKIVFPIKDKLNRVVGLIGRSIDTKEFKIFVTEEAKITGFFYGLPQALPHIYREGIVYFVEGPFDMHAVRKVFLNTVCTLTSGMSENQYNLIKRYCDKIIVIFDSDKSGDRGAKEAMEYGGVDKMSLGYKDPAKALEVLGENRFKELVLRGIGQYGI
jgi:DNA primase